MTNQVLFIQGGGEGTHDEWDNTILESLVRELGPDYAVRYPRMPHEADPKYATWKATLKRQFAGLDDGAILIADSIGGTILIRALADDPPRWTFGGIFLIAAPFVGDGGWHSEDIEPFSDLGAKLPEQTPIYLYPRKQGRRRPRSNTCSSTQRPFRTLSCADSPGATISSITTCQKLPAISGALELCVCPRRELRLGKIAGDRVASAYTAPADSRRP